MHMGVNIKEYRLAKELTRYELAEKLKISTSALANYENGNRIPNLLMVKEIAKVLNVSVLELLDDNCFSGPGKLQSEFLSYIKTLYSLGTDKKEFINYIQDEFDEFHLNKFQVQYIKQIDDHLRNANNLSNSLDFLDDINLTIENTKTLKNTLGNGMSEYEKDILILLTSKELESKLQYDFNEISTDSEFLKDLINRIYQIIKTEINIYKNKS